MLQKQYFFETVRIYGFSDSLQPLDRSEKVRGGESGPTDKKFEEPEGKVRFLTPDEDSRLLVAVKQPLRTIILVGIHTGLRIFAEALTLHGENVDLVSGFVTVETAYAKGKQTDTLPINRILVEALARLNMTATSEWVFVNRSGKCYQPIRTAFENDCRHAKPADVTPHTCGTRSRADWGCRAQGTGHFRRLDAGRNRK